MNPKSSYITTLSKQSNKSKRSETQNYQELPTKFSFQRWLGRLFCAHQTESKSISPPKMDMSQMESIGQQPTIKIFKKLFDFDATYIQNTKEPYKILSQKNCEDFLGFVTQFQKHYVANELDIYKNALHVDNNSIVLLLIQKPNLDLIKYLEEQVTYLIIQLPNKQNAEPLKQYISEKLILGTKENRLAEQIPELIIGKTIHRQMQIVNKIILIPDFTIDGKQYLIEQTDQLLKAMPSRIDKLIFLLSPQCTQEHLIQLGSLVNNYFLLRHEVTQWMQRMRYTYKNKDIVKVNVKDSKKNPLLGSQYVHLSGKQKIQLPYNFSVDNFELITQIIGFYNNERTLLLILRIKMNLKKSLHEDEFNIQQSIINDSQISNIGLYFVKQIFFTDQFKSLTQYDNADYEVFEAIINQSSYVSCCLCIQLLKDEQITLEQLLNESSYKSYIQILVGTGILHQEQDCLAVQFILKKYFSKIQILSAFIQRNFNMSESQFQQQQQQQQHQQQQQQEYVCEDKAASLEYNFSENGNDGLGYSEMHNPEIAFTKFRKSLNPQNNTLFSNSFYDQQSPIEVYNYE